jgi:hypothetical protein
VLLLHCPKAFSHCADRFVPGHPCQLSIFPQQRIQRATLGLDRVVLGQAFRAQLPAIHRMFRIAANGHNLVLAHAQLHSATH